jgi:hypothetical protein
MSKTMTWAYDTAEQMRNVKDELQSDGIPSENVFIDEEGRKIKVMVAEASQPGIVEILERHGLKPAAS